MVTSRKRFLLSGGVAAAAAALPGGDAIAANAAPRMTPAEALRRLLDGNSRFANDHPSCLQTTALRADLAEGQAPFAMVLGCSDSRVPVETIFDHEPGDIFVVRVAGNFADPAGIGSLEYGFSVLKASLLIVLGHSKCGAVTAALESSKTGKALPGHIQTLVESIAPNVRGTGSLRPAIIANVRANVAKLKASEPILAPGVRDGKLNVVGAVYGLHTGRVELV